MPDKPATNLIGRTFTFWTVTAFVQTDDDCETWLCCCRCGRYGKVITSDLMEKNTVSCGCYVTPEQQQAVKIKRLMKKHPHEAHVWKRCKRDGSLYYRWANDFSKFLQEVGAAPSPHHLLLRKHPHQLHKPKNTFWGTHTERRPAKRKIRHQGRIYTIREFARLTGIPQTWIENRYCGQGPLEGEVFVERFQEHMLAKAQAVISAQPQ